MAGKLKQLIFCSVFIVLITVSTSCSTNSNTQSSDTYLLSTRTPLPNNAPLTTPIFITPTPSPLASDNTSFLPEKGSILRWMDLSNFVYLPEGTYTLGEESFTPSDHSPAHQVSLAGFWIQQTEVTNQQYAQCVENGQCSPPNQEVDAPYIFGEPLSVNYPVVGITWYQAQEYCMYIDARLPTEAEWESAARGMVASSYPWGEGAPGCELANYDNCLSPSTLAEVGSFQNGSSEYEAQDMAGNVFEWVNDWYSDTYYAASTTNNPTGPQQGTQRLIRGGAYNSVLNEILAYSRAAMEPESHSSNLGFRCVLFTDPLSESELTIARPCQVNAINYQQTNQPTNTPYPCAPGSVSTSCQYQGGQRVNTILIEQNGCLENQLHSFSANSQGLTCSVSHTSGGQNEYFCNFSTMIQAKEIEVSYCFPQTLRKVVKICPTGYQLDQKTLLCEIKDSKLPDAPCSNGYQELAPYGCLPLYDVNNGGCPVGFYNSSLSSTNICIPLDNCNLTNQSELCQNPSCSVGLIYDTEKACCASPDEPYKLCPTGYFFEEDQKVCLDSTIYPFECHTEKVTFSYCANFIKPTLTLTQQVESEPVSASATLRASATAHPSKTPTKPPPTITLTPSLTVTATDVCRRQWNPATKGWDYICN